MDTTEILKKVLDSAEVGIYVSDYYTCEVLFINRKSAAFRGIEPEEAIGRKCWEFVHDTQGRCDFCPYERLLDDEGKPCKPYIWEFYLPKYDIWIKSTNEAVIWPDGRLVNMVTYYNITETKNMQRRLADLAFFDQNLGIKNGLSLERDVSEKQDKPSLIIFDILSLRKINDAYGRVVGDTLLQSIRDWIKRRYISNSELYRIGGDEFCLTIADASIEQLLSYAGILGERFSRPWDLGPGNNKLSVFCNISIGVIHGEIIENSEPPLNLIERVLEAAKTNGNLTIYDRRMDDEYKKRLRLEMALKRCVRENMDGFDVYYEPIANPVTGMWCGLEALCRWNSTELGPVPPLVFIQEAERLNLIGEIGLWVLETSLKRCIEWGLDKHEKFILNVNFSAIQFLDESLAVKVLGVLKKYGFPGSKLSIEITESTRFTFTDRSLETIETFRKNDILVALDDFGTGYSAFNNLKTLPIDIVKIERVFITDIEKDSYQQYLFKVMADLAHAADMKLIAEGVEHREQIDILLNNGADMLQGYLFSKPLPPEMVRERLNSFHEVDESFAINRNKHTGVERLVRAHGGQPLTHGLYKTLNQCMRTLFRNKPGTNPVNRTLEIVAKHLEISRAYVFLKSEGNIFHLANEWHADDVIPQSGYSAHIRIPEEWESSFRTQGILLCPNVASMSRFPPYARAHLLERNTKSILALPLNEGDRFFGFVGFDDCRYQRDWMPEEIHMLHDLCLILAIVTGKFELPGTAEC